MSYGQLANVGIIFQDSYGTVGSVDSIHFIPHLSENIGLNIPPIYSENMTGRFDEGDTYEGPRTCEGDLESQAQPIALGAMLKSILNTCKGHSLPKLLIEVKDLEDNPTPLQDFNTVKLMQKLGYERVHKIAVLDKLENKSANDVFEGFAYNTKLKIRFFYSEPDAMNFLSLK